MAIKNLEQLSKDYAYRTECDACLNETSPENCKERPFCARYNIAVIDYTAGYNDALKTIIIRNR